MLGVRHSNKRYRAAAPARWPVVSAFVDADGTGEVRVSGAPHAIQADTLNDARLEVLDHVQRVARDIGRPIRASVTDPDGTSTIAVDPDGRVSELSEFDDRWRTRGARRALGTTITLAATIAAVAAGAYWFGHRGQPDEPPSGGQAGAAQPDRTGRTPDTSPAADRPRRAAAVDPPRLALAWSAGNRRRNASTVRWTPDGAVTLRGRLTSAAGDPIGGVKVTVTELGEDRRPHQVRTDRTGRFALEQTIGHGPAERRLAAAYLTGRTKGEPAARATATLRIKAALNITKADREVRSGGVARLEGRVRSTPAAGVPIEIYLRRQGDARYWHYVTVRSEPNGDWEGGVLFPSSTRGAVRIVARVPADQRSGFLGDTTKPMTVRIKKEAS